ncbi:MAG TPA: putative quinol monooxygenase [Sphingorhabdus sp.]|nr:putative quinol monooxygenase [Sphingorhabdus sp.]
MIIVQGFMKVQPDDFALYRKRVVLHAAFVQTLDGCLQYSLSEDPGIPGLIWVAERWRDKASQAAHLGGDHMGQFNEFMKHMPVEAAHIASYDVAGEGEWLMRVGNSAVS